MILELIREVVQAIGGDADKAECAACQLRPELRPASRAYREAVAKRKREE